ncbi:MAG: FUSC family protein [Saprospiraceae bacterium]
MKQKELPELKDQNLLDNAKEAKLNSIINAVLIGFLIGIVIYSVAKNNFGFFTLIPLFFIYKLINKNKQQ